MSIFMKADGMKGSATAKGYTDWSVVHNTHFMMQRDIPFAVGRTDSRYTVPNFQHVTLIKPVDASSSGLFTAMCKGSVIATVQIDMCRTGDTLQPYLQYTLHNVLVAHIEDTANAASGTLERVSLNYTKIDKRYISSNSVGQSQSPVSVAYDLPTAKVS